MDVLGYLDKSIATFASDPPANDFQRGCLDTLKIARAELASALADDKPVPRVTTPDPQAAELVERLRRKYVRIPGTGERLVNPDGRAAADLIERLTRTPEPSLREALEGALAKAYLAGATDVHIYWRAGGSDTEPDFAEASRDYALEHIDSALSASPAEPEVSDAMIEAVARALSPHMVRALAGCGSGAWDFPLLTDKERNRVKDAAAEAIAALRSAVQRGDGDTAGLPPLQSTTLERDA